MLQEFDDLMRSASTMKMSLTPDRLKTMEVSFFPPPLSQGYHTVVAKSSITLIGLQTRKTNSAACPPDREAGL